MHRKNLRLILLGVLFAVPVFATLILTGRITTSSAQSVITLDPGTTYQTITGWEATAQAGQLECPGFTNYKDELFDQAVDDLGINRVRLEVRSGAEHPVDYFASYIRGEIGRSELTLHWYESVNDNSDAFAMDPNGFQFSEIDHTIGSVILPLKQRLEVRGEKLFINVTYVDFGDSSFEHKEDPEEYAEFVLATYLHLESTYGWLPDAWEVILEPDTSAGWSGRNIGRAIAAAADRLETHGFDPAFIAPSTANMGNALGWFDQMFQVPGVLEHLLELSYHRYRGVSDANLETIASRAGRYGINTSMLEHIGSGYKDLHKDLKLGRSSAWQQFALAFCTNDNGAQYYWIDNSDPDHPIVNIGRRSRFLQQYFKYIREGAVRIGASTDNRNLDPLAFINSDGKYVVVALAQRGGPFVIQGLPPGNYGVKYSTSRNFDVDLPEAAIGVGEGLNVSIEAPGVITVYAKMSSTTAATRSWRPILRRPMSR